MKRPTGTIDENENDFTSEELSNSDDEGKNEKEDKPRGQTMAERRANRQSMMNTFGGTEKKKNSLLSVTESLMASE